MSRFLAIGGAHMDRRGTIRGRTHMHASNPGAWHLQPGGGAFNAARGLARLGHAVRLISPRGGDEDGLLVARAAAEAGVIDMPITFLDRRTPSYTAILDEDGELIIALAEMDLYERFSPRQFDRRAMRDAIAAADWVLADANLPAPTLLKLAERREEAGKPLAAIAISPAKVERLRPILNRLAILFMNEREAAALTGRQQPATDQISALDALGLRSGVISAGERPAVAFDAEAAWCCKAAPVAEIADVTGAGDALAAATLAALSEGLALPAALRHGMAAAAIVVASPEASPASLDGAALRLSLSGVPAAEPMAKPAAQGGSMARRLRHDPNPHAGPLLMSNPKIDPSLLVHSPEVRDALEAGRPVVALESTIITHGMPFPGNLEMARSVEAIIRDNGAIPATIAILGGTIHVGLSEAELERLAETRDAMKVSRADLAFAVAEGRNGATTVAATMMVAYMAGIAVFATGGIGGVHRGAELSFDVSADLEELARTPVTVVCAGAKAILDLPKTLEVLETRGVPVVSFGQDAFPAFWSRDSGLPSPLRLDTPEALARFQATRRALGISGGLLVANPVAAEDEIVRAEMEGHIAEALRRATVAEVSGKAVTPFLLSEILKLTDGRSLETNIALVRNNARLAAEIAVASQNA